jgi:hypothetical protein
MQLLAEDDNDYRVAVVEAGDFDPDHEWEYPSHEGSLLGKTIKEFIAIESDFLQAMGTADGFDQAAIKGEQVSQWAVVVPPGSPASVGDAVWCRGVVYGGN